MRLIACLRSPRVASYIAPKIPSLVALSFSFLAMDFRWSATEASSRRWNLKMAHLLWSGSMIPEE